MVDNPMQVNNGIGEEKNYYASWSLLKEKE